MDSMYAELRRLGKLLCDSEDAALVQAHFREFVLGSELAEYLERLIHGEGLETLVADAQRHPNSFNKYVLASEPETGAKLVLHTWMAQEPVDESEMHTHRWDFVSFVLRGSLASETLRVEENGDLVVNEYAYRSPDGSDTFRLQPVGPERLSVVDEARYYAGDCYVQDHSLIHRARVTAPGTVTIILQGSVSRLQTRVFRESSKKPDRNILVNRLTSDIAVRDLTELISLLSYERR